MDTPEDEKQAIYLMGQYAYEAGWGCECPESVAFPEWFYQGYKDAEEGRLKDGYSENF